MANDGVMQYFAKIGLEVSDFLSGIEKAQGGILAFYRDVTVSMEMTMEIFNRVSDTIRKVGESAQYLLDLSYQTGVTTDKLQRMQIVAAMAGTEFGTISTAMNRLSLSMADAADASTEAAKAFQDLGVTTSGKTIDEVFDDTAVALTNMDDETRRASDAMAIYGRNYKDLLPYLKEFVDKQEEVKNEVVLTNDELKTNAALWSEIETRSVRGQNAIATGISLLGSYFDKLYKGYDEAARRQYLAGQLTAAQYEQMTGKKLSGDLTEGFDLSDIPDQLSPIKSAADEVAKSFDNMGKAADNSVKVTVKAAKTAWASSSVVGSAGSEMYSFLMGEMQKGTDYQTALQNWMNGTPTNTAIEGTLGAEGATYSETETISKDLDDQLKTYTTKYAEIEQVNLKHWTAMGETARKTMQDMGLWWATEVNWINGTVAYAQTITMSDGKANAAPINFEKVTAPMLGKTDYSGISFLGGGSEKAGTGSGSKSSVDVKIEVKAKDDTEVVATAIQSQGI